MNRPLRAGALLAGLAALALMSAGCASGGSPSPSGGGSGGFEALEPIELTFNHTNPAGTHFEESAVAFMDYVTEHTDGKVTFQPSYGGALLTAPEATSGVGSGVADISYTTTIGFEDNFPVGSWLSTAMTQDVDHYLLNTLTNYLAADEIIYEEPALLAEFHAQNVQPLWFASSGRGDMLCVDPINSVSDASGRLTRSGGARLTTEVEAFDMSPVSMPFADLYEGLQRGVINCVYTVNGMTTFKPYGLTEVAKNYIPVDGWTPLGAQGFVVNLDRWNSFSPELQEVFREGALDAMVAYTEGAFGEMVELAATADADGVEFNDGDELSAVLADLHDEQFASMVDDAPDGLDDPQGVIDTLQEYRSALSDLLSSSVKEVDGDRKQVLAEAMESVDWEAVRAALRDRAAAH